MDDIDDLFEELNSLRKKQKQIINQSVKQVSDYVMNMDFASLYPSTMTMYFPKKHTKISKIKKILDNINDTERT
jgi:DNA polymerase elongation subunit (family B)